MMEVSFPAYSSHPRYRYNFAEQDRKNALEEYPLFYARQGRGYTPYSVRGYPMIN